MAAHVITGLRDILSWEEADDSHIGYLSGALSLMSWTQELDMVDWEMLNNITTDYLTNPETRPRALYHLWLVATILLCKYLPLWDELDQPATREEWLKAKFPDTENS